MAVYQLVIDLATAWALTAHWYLLYVPPLAVGAVWAATVACHGDTDADSGKWSVVSGILLGFAGSIQLGQATVAALTVAGVYGWERDVRSLSYTALAAAIIASPTIPVMMVHAGQYSSHASQYLDGLQYHAPALVATVVVGVGIIALRPTANRTGGPMTAPILGALTGSWVGTSVVTAADPTYWGPASMTVVAPLLAVAVLNY